MKGNLVMMMVVLVGCGTTKADSAPPARHEVDPRAPANFSDPNVERAVRQELKKIRVELPKPEGELTNADLAKLTRLIFGYTEITREGLNLKDVAKLQNLTKLGLGGQKITGAGLRELTKLQNLEQLGLDSTKITDANLKQVAKFQKLTWLNLSYTKITDVGLKELAKLQKLVFLDLQNTKITDAGLKDLVKLKRLESLWLYDTKVTKAGVAELKKALPNCEIAGP